MQKGKRLRDSDTVRREMQYLESLGTGKVLRGEDREVGQAPGVLRVEAGEDQKIAIINTILFAKFLLFS